MLPSTWVPFCYLTSKSLSAEAICAGATDADGDGDGDGGDGDGNDSEACR